MNMPPDEARRLRSRWLFIHFVPVGSAKHEIAFQGDTAISPDVCFDERLDRMEPVYRHRIHIPDDVPPGEYEIEIGILIPMHNKRIRVTEADGPRTNNSTTIGRIRVTPLAAQASCHGPQLMAIVSRTTVVWSGTKRPNSCGRTA